MEMVEFWSSSEELNNNTVRFSSLSLNLISALLVREEEMLPRLLWRERKERVRDVWRYSAETRRVDWNIKNSAGDTPVMFCLKTNKIEMARCLINTPGVDLDTVDRDGKYLETIAR